MQCVEMVELLFLIPKENDQSHQVTVAAAGGAQARFYLVSGMNFAYPARKWPTSNLLTSR